MSILGLWTRMVSLLAAGTLPWLDCLSCRGMVIAIKIAMRVHSALPSYGLPARRASGETPDAPWAWATQTEDGPARLGPHGVTRDQGRRMRPFWRKERPMKALVVYDTKFGNTERLARAIAAALGAGESADVMTAAAASARDLAGVDLLAVGGPTQGHGLSPALRTFLDGLPPQAVRDLPAVAFDTRLHGPRLLTGSAAAATAKRLEKKGARLVAPPESFLVGGTEGPLAETELDRAMTWGTDVRAAASRSLRERAGVTP